MKKTTTKMMSGGKATAKKMSGGKTYKIGGKTTPKKKVGGATDEKCWPGKPGCVEGNYNKGRGTGPMSKLKAVGQKIRSAVGPGRVRKVKVGK